MQDEIGRYYDRRREQAKRLREDLARAERRGADADEIRRLERMLEQARYVGD